MTTTVKQRAKLAAWALVAVAVAAAPVGVSAAVQSTSNIINATVADAISVSTPGAVTIAITPATGGRLTSSSDVVTVSTNKSTGYNLSVADQDATTTMVNGANNITASAGTKTAPITLATNTWGVAVVTSTLGIGTNGFDASYAVETSSSSSTSKWAGMPATGSPMTLKSTASAAVGDTTTVWYAAKADLSIPSGTYSDTVTYTATTN